MYNAKFPQSGSTSIGMMLLRFLGGMGTIFLASILGGFVGGYIISVFRVGPHAPWQPIDKNVGLESAIYGIIGGNFLTMAALAWYSSRRREWMLFSGGLAFFASELSLLFTARQEGVGLGLLMLIVLIVLGAFVFGVTITPKYRDVPLSR